MAAERAPLSPILAATDFSEPAGHAARRAAMLAREHGGEMELVHVVPRAPLEALRAAFRAAPQEAAKLVDEVRATLSRAAEALGAEAGVRVTSRVEVGDVPDAILAACDAAGLLVVGARGTSPMRDFILGTTAERLLGRCTRPVLVVRQPPREPYRRLIVGVDFSDYSEGALRAALQVAPEAAIAAVHAYDVPFEGRLRLAGVTDEAIEAYRTEAAQKAVLAIGALGEKLAGRADRFAPVVERAHAARLILDRQKTLGADLIVVAKHARSTPEALLLGSVARHVLADTGCDVLVVHRAGGA